MTEEQKEEFYKFAEWCTSQGYYSAWGWNFNGNYQEMKNTVAEYLDEV